jgi:hypothetical protein
MNPPRDPANNEGYFEYIEGPATTGASIAVNSQWTGSPADTTVGDFDDILMFTTRSTGKPFVGKLNGGVAQSDVAEVAWFVRGRTLHRRVLLVAPSAPLPSTLTPAGYYQNYDVSARWNGTRLVANSLADLTRRECRFAHKPAFPVSGGCAYWTWTFTGDSLGRTFPTLPTLNECSTSGWSTENGGAVTSLSSAPDFWTNDASRRIADNALIGGGTNAGTRVSDDIILTNVIGFDVKAWDPTAPVMGTAQNPVYPGDPTYVALVNAGNTPISYGAYADLGYLGSGNGLRSYGDTKASLQGSASTARVYDTFSTSHFGTLWNDGIDKDASGYANGIVDDDAERANVPPYSVPLRGIQVKIRVFEPDSKQIREVTVVQDFLPQ